MSISEKQIASLLLQIKAIKINVAKPFQWTSGWKSPIYCDNRKTLSYPEIRIVIKEQFIELINNKFKNVEAIAGIATGAIAIGAIIADALNLPFLYVRSSQKNHGLQNLIEGEKAGWDYYPFPTKENVESYIKEMKKGNIENAQLYKPTEIRTLTEHIV